MTHWWPRLARGMPRVQKIEPVWIGAGQELSGESTNCSKLTFVPPGGTQTGIERQSDPKKPSNITPSPHSPTPPPSKAAQLSSSLHQSHLIVFPSEVLYINNWLYVIPTPLFSPAEVPFWEQPLVPGCLGVRGVAAKEGLGGVVGKLLMCRGSPFLQCCAWNAFNGLRFLLNHTRWLLLCTAAAATSPFPFRNK